MTVEEVKRMCGASVKKGYRTGGAKEKQNWGEGLMHPDRVICTLKPKSGEISI